MCWRNQNIAFSSFFWINMKISDSFTDNSVGIWFSIHIQWLDGLIIALHLQHRNVYNTFQYHQFSGLQCSALFSLNKKLS